MNSAPLRVSRYTGITCGPCGQHIVSDGLQRKRAAVQDRTQDAIDKYHKALALRPEDTFVAEMLTLAMQDSAKRDFSF